jgi:hypothetical protein
MFLAAIAVGLQISVLRYFLFECWWCRSIKLTPKDFDKLSDEGKLVAFRSAVDDFYRYHQFWGGMVIVQLPFFYGLITKHVTGRCSVYVAFALAAILEVATIFAAIESYERYVHRSRSILGGGQNA